MKKRVLLIFGLVLMLMSTVAFAWYSMEDANTQVTIDEVQLTLDSVENEGMRLVPTGFAWFRGQTDNYVYTYKFNGVLVDTKEFAIDLIVNNTTNKAVIEQYLYIETLVTEDTVLNETTIVVTLKMSLPSYEHFGIMRGIVADVTFNIRPVTI